MWIVRPLRYPDPAEKQERPKRSLEQIKRLGDHNRAPKIAIQTLAAGEAPESPQGHDDSVEQGGITQAAMDFNERHASLS